MNMNTRYLRKLAREACGACTSTPVTVISGDGAPEINGKSYYWTTPSGKTIVHHPNAYGWPTWYHHSTLRVVVGADWLHKERDRRHELWRGR